MKYLIDTNIISEIQKSDCNPAVKSFIEKIPAEDIFLSVITIGELSYGMEKLPAGKKKHKVALWLYTELPKFFKGRVIPIDTEVMLEWGKLRALSDRTMPTMDSLIAVSALCHHMTLVTRNTRDFEGIAGITLVNPWE